MPSIVTENISKAKGAADLSKTLKIKGRKGGKSGPARPNHSQHQKSVSLQLYTDGKISGNLPAHGEFIFPINPEEFNLTYNHKIQVVQTLGDPFIDEFGAGMPSLSMRGTTGWRTRPGSENVDGHEAFERLRRDFIKKYFELRHEKQKNNQDPEDIKLIVVNGVDDLIFQVVPVDFRLLRSKSSPLLYRYDLTFKTVSDFSDKTVSQAPVSTNKIQSRNWLDALKERSEPLTEKLLASTSSVCNTVGNFIQDTVGILSAAKSGVGDVANFIGGVTGSIESVLNALGDTEIFFDDLFLEGIIELNNLTGGMGEFNCYLSKASLDSLMPDFSGIRGISDCAAIHGIKAGSRADCADNAFEWVHELNQTAKQNGTTSLMATSYADDVLPDIFDEPDTAIIISSSLDAKLTTLENIARDTSSASTLGEAYTAIEEALNCFTFKPDKVPEEDELEGDLISLARFKRVVVKENQTLMDIAYQEYSDADRWTDIADANDIVVESCAKNLAPYTRFALSEDLYAGQTRITIAYDVPTEYAARGCTLELKDNEGRRQTLQVDSVERNTISLHETVSTNLEAPISVVRYVNLAEYGISNGVTELTRDTNAGLKTYHLENIKDIYPGYVLFISGNAEARAYTVSSVNYLEKSIRVEESSIGFTTGARVEIFNTETSMVHLAPGTQLNIPVSSEDNAGTVQNDNEIYGGDLTLDSGGFLSVVDGDLELSEGMANLKQAIVHRVISEYGSLVIHPSYGCGLLSIAGKKNTPAVNTLARAALVEALQREPRLSRMTGLNVVTRGDIIQFSAEVQSTDSNTTTDLNYVIGV
ncbi:MAG: hypothetical protein MI863_05220 [Desulfobacterales bacterium]|nr:hypothetical protein [Desulfobacterales bacterium]